MERSISAKVIPSTKDHKVNLQEIKKKTHKPKVNPEIYLHKLLSPWKWPVI